ncbi:hypothetical protein ACFW04_011757 [Cataglyphis niger]
MIREMRQEMRNEIRNIHAEIYDIRIGGTQYRRDNGNKTSPGEWTDTTYDFILDEYVQFLSATMYAMEHIDPLDKVTLLGAVLCTKLKGRVMLHFQMRKIRDVTPLKLEVYYASKKSTTYLQIEFNTLKQKTGESAQTYGLRTDKLAVELYESMIEGRHHTVDNKRAIIEIIQQQALENFQIRLEDNIKFKYYILKLFNREDILRCKKLPNRYTNRFPLPTSDRSSRVNTVNKYCNYCKKSGYDCEKCWLLHRRSNKD